MQSALTSAIAAADAELSIELARTAAQIVEAKRLRYKVYCEERGFETGQDGLEQDEYDDRSRHVLVRSRSTGVVFGTVRLVLAPEPAACGFPMDKVCEAWVLAPLPRNATAEISRFALTRDRPGLSPAASALMRLYLTRGVIAWSGELGLTHWCAVMERTLLRLLRATSIYFLPVGPAVAYHGLRQPAIFTLADGLERMRRENREVWRFLTQDGSLWSPAMVPALSAATSSARSA